VLAKIQRQICTKTRQLNLLENKTTEKRHYPVQKAFEEYMSHKNSVTNFNPIQKAVHIDSFPSESDEPPPNKTDPLLTEKQQLVTMIY
jgi:hypothetical protein